MNNAIAVLTSAGDVTVKFRQSVCTSCPMDATFYPFDRPQCTIELAASLLSGARLLAALPIVSPPSLQSSPTVLTVGSKEWKVDRFD